VIEFWNELLARVQWIRELYATSRITLPLGQGLADSLNEAEACARGDKRRSGTEDDVSVSIRSCHVAWSLYDSLSGCVDAGLDVRPYLANIATGSTEYGVPSDPANFHDIFFKDFEAELFVAASLARAGLPVSFIDPRNDPRGEMKVGDIFIEVKHPNSRNAQERLMRKFNSALRKDRLLGVFVCALEDAFQIAPRSSTPHELGTWQEAKDKEIEAIGLRSVMRAASLSQIAVLAQTSSYVEIVGDSTRFVRKGNALIFDQRSYDLGILTSLERIATAFNPDPPRYSQIKNALPTSMSRSRE
jgi:hypothetical protein